LEFSQIDAKVHNATLIALVVWMQAGCFRSCSAAWVFRKSLLGSDDQYRALGVSEDGVTMWPNKTRDLICIGAADHGELYLAIAHTKKIGDAGSGCGSV
jgi:hypothetical protein